ncbi:MAG: FAD:protein FMN transferase [Oscillospiraceae bacterium]|nr:FAD:protein FMN transferase [Oscillospiraceae bacterium]
MEPRRGQRRRRYRILAAACAAALWLFLASCGRESPPAPSGPEETRLDFFCMDTYMSLRAWGTDPDTLREAKKEAEGLEALLSVTDEDSEIARLNEAGSAALSPETAAVLARALELCHETEGALDISVYPIVRAWGFTTGQYRVPEKGELDALLETVDFRKIGLEGLDASLPEGMALDLGGIAKGWAGDRMAEALRASGVQSALLDLGGNIQTVGRKPDGSLWRIAVKDPDGSGTLGVLSVSDSAVITSGGYERFFTGEDGTVYWHIMDPETGACARSGLLSVTVTGPEGARCDAYSTALFVMGEARAADFWRARRDFGMVLVTEEGRVLYTPDLADSFAPEKGTKYAFEVIPDA